MMLVAIAAVGACAVACSAASVRTDADAGDGGRAASDAGNDGNGLADGGVDSAVSCVGAIPASCLLPKAPDRDYKACADPTGAWTDAGLAQLALTCQGAVGIWQSVSCSRTGIVGGCRVSYPSAGGCETTWYYGNDAGVTTVFVASECQKANGEYIPP